MPLNRRTTRTFHRRLYATELESVTLLKRKDDQKQGTVTSHKLFQCRWSRTIKTGEPLAGEMLSSHAAQLHIPRIELDRIKVHYINPIDRFIDRKGRTWQPESTTTITEKLFSNHVCVDLLLIGGEQLHG